MHEFSLAQSIIDTVLEVACGHEANRILAMNLEIGEAALVNAEQLVWYVERLAQETLASNMEINVTEVPVRITCLLCGYEGGVEYHEKAPTWHVSVPSFECPKCHSARTIITAGRELNVKDINIQLGEEDEEEGEKDNA